MSVNRSDQDYEVLSAYIDGELSDSERLALEQRLAGDPSLQAELDSLRQTVALIKQLPSRRAPRDFTLPAGFSRRKVLPFPLRPVFSALSSAAAMLLFVFGAYFLARSNAMPIQTQQTVLQAPAAQVQFTEVAMDNFADATATELSPTLRSLPSPSPAPTQAPATQPPVSAPGEDQDFAAEAEENRVTQADTTLNQQAPSAASQDGEASSETLGFTAPDTNDLADDSTLMYRAETTTPVPPSTSELVLPEVSAGAANAAEPQTEVSMTTLATPTAEASVAIDEAESDLLEAPNDDGQDRPDEAAIRQRLQTTPATPFAGLILLALGALFTLVAALTTLLRRRRRS